MLGCLLLTSCEDFLDVNQNPAQPTEAPANFRFRAMIDLTYQTKHACNMQAARMIQYWHYTGANSGSDCFSMTNYTTTYLWWYALYIYQGTNVEIAIKDAEEKGAWHVAGAIKIFNAYTWLMTTDWLGDIPLSEAFIEKLDPKYDNQKDIYEYVHKLCDEGILYLKRVNDDEVMPLSEAEYIYNGDVNRWIKFAYLVKARAELHKYPYKTGQYNLDKVISYCNQSFVGNDDDFRQNSNAASNIETHKNYWSKTRENLNSYRQSKRLVELMDGTIFQKDDGSGVMVPVQDPRLAAMFYPTVSDGIYYGITPPQGNQNSIPQMYDKVWSSPDYKPEIATYAEVCFIKAEAYFHSGDKDAALEEMQKGIRAHMQTLKIPETDISAYINSGALATVGNDLTFGQLMSQKNIAMFLLAEESWTDFRRYDYEPTIFLGLEKPTYIVGEMSDQWPRRFTYLQYSEFDYNRGELRAIEALTADDAAYWPYYYKRVWWNRPEEDSDRVYRVTPIYN